MTTNKNTKKTATSQFKKIMVLAAIGWISLSTSACTIPGNTSTAAAPAPAVQELKTPDKTILVTTGDLSRPYSVLGEVRCSLASKSVFGMGSDKSELIYQELQKVAFTQYGSAVDAIITTRTNQAGGAGILSSLGAISGVNKDTGYGVAVSFKK
jgi:hypothetical protein